MNLEKYLRAVRRRLNMPKQLKDRVMNDLISSVEARKEEGLTEADIFAELGTPKAAAAELNQQMAEYTYRKSPWRWLCFALMILCVLMLVHGGLRGLLAAALTATHAASVGIIGGADGPTAIFVTTSPDFLRYTYCLVGLLLGMSIIGFIVLSRRKQK